MCARGLRNRLGFRRHITPCHGSEHVHAMPMQIWLRVADADFRVVRAHTLTALLGQRRINDLRRQVQAC